MELTWGPKERAGSRITPRFRARGEGVMVEVSTVNEVGPVFLRVDLVPMRRSSVLSLLSLRELWVSNVFIVEMQVSNWVRGGFWVGLVVMYIWVSSA